MSLTGEAWITSPQRRALEVGTVSAFAPPAAVVGATAYAAFALAQGTEHAITEVERSLYPGDNFGMKKLGNPKSEDGLSRVLRQAMIDELPQFAAVLQGKMSLFGPRADTPSHISALFAAIEDMPEHDRWLEARTAQKPGIISSYATHSHENNLSGEAESDRFPDDDETTVRSNALLRARLDSYDFVNAGPRHELALLGKTASMARGNYMQYIRGFGRRLGFSLSNS